jgi:hypothetical protein
LEPPLNRAGPVMNFKPLSVLVAIGMASMIGYAVYKAGPGAVAPQLADALRPPEPPAPPPIDAAIARGCEFLRTRQSPDGAWRSDVYAMFKDGTALTPLVVVALQAADALPEERKKAAAWLAKMAKSDGTIDEGPDGLTQPVYSAALSVTALSHPENAAHVKARDAWLKYLLDRQLTEQNGWSPEDKQYGGWGYYPLVPKKPVPGQIVPAQQLLESNLSATTFALDALTAAGVSDQKVWVAAGRFVRSCENPDGGFHFVYDDPVRNKAGGDGTGRFYSYGSATADGIRSWASIVKATGMKVAVSMDWLDKNFSPDTHPGNYIPTHESNRNAVFFYYAASVASTCQRVKAPDINSRPAVALLTSALITKQQPDGSWINPVELVRENDPLLATTYAVQALGECRRSQK